MATLIPLASGKGGVGKSVLAVNLSLDLAARGKRVILADLDWGGSNAHTILGVLNNHAGVGDFLADKALTLAELVVPLSPHGIGFLPGDGQRTATANLPFVRKQKLVKELLTLDADYVVLDLGAGSHLNTVDLFLSSALGLVITTPEPTAVLNAYTFLKTALFRLMYQSMPPRSSARDRLVLYFSGKGPFQGAQGLVDLMETVGLENVEWRRKLETARERLKPRIVLNEVVETDELNLGARLRQVCEKQLGLTVEYVAVIPQDPRVRTSVIERSPLLLSHPQTPFCRGVKALADRIVRSAFAAEPPLGSFEDLEGLADLL